MFNQCQFIGNLGADPEIKSFDNGGRIANLRLAVSETWKDKATGEKKERTEWVSVTVASDGLVGVVERYLRKGSKVFVSGKMRTRKWQDQNGNDRYSTEIVLTGFDAKLVMLSGKQEGDQGGQQAQQEQGPADWDLDDEVPF
jgi:single-strand DNA-binding protein